MINYDWLWVSLLMQINSFWRIVNHCNQSQSHKSWRITNYQSRNVIVIGIACIFQTSGTHDKGPMPDCDMRHILQINPAGKDLRSEEFKHCPAVASFLTNPICHNILGPEPIASLSVISLFFWSCHKKWVLTIYQHAWPPPTTSSQPLYGYSYWENKWDILSDPFL